MSKGHEDISARNFEFNRTNPVNKKCTTFKERRRRVKSGAEVMAISKEEKLKGGRRMSGVMKPPEGGWGWVIVAGCFLATICIRAVTRYWPFCPYMSHIMLKLNITVHLWNILCQCYLCLQWLSRPLTGHWEKVHTYYHNVITYPFKWLANSCLLCMSTARILGFHS